MKYFSIMFISLLNAIIVLAALSAPVLLAITRDDNRWLFMWALILILPTIKYTVKSDD